MSFFKKDNSTYFIIKHTPNNAAFKVKDNYFLAFFKGKRVKKEVFQDDFKDVLFKGFFVENINNGLRIIVKTSSKYKPVYSVDNDTVIIKAHLKQKKKDSIVYKKIPSTLTAIPFYISDKVFMKKNTQESASYDESLFFMGIKMFANKNYSMAAQFFKEIIDKYPQSSFYASSYFLLGDCYKSAKNYQKAIDVYKKAIQISPKNDTVAQTLFSMAEIYANMKFYLRVRSIYKSIMKDYANTKWSDKAGYMLAKSYYDGNKFDKALNILLNTKKNSSYYTLSMLLSSEIFIKENNDAKAVLAYYSMSDKLNSIDIQNHYKELIDVAGALCRFSDYSSADAIFKYIETSVNNDITEKSYIGRMRCDLDKSDYDDLKNRADYIISNSKNSKNIFEAKKLLDEAKLKKGDVNKDTIDKILNKYANDPDVAALALYVYAKENYKNGEYKKAVSYIIKLEKFYPSSPYNQKTNTVANKCIDKLLDDFYRYPNRQNLDFIYNSVIHLNAFEADMCRLAVALSATDKIGSMNKILPHIKDKNCRGAMYAKYYTEKGNNKKALEYVGNIEKSTAYIYYVDIVMGDVNYFKGCYGKAAEFYKKSLKITNKLVKNYISLKIAHTLYASKKYEQSIQYADRVKIELYRNKARYLKALDLYCLNRYKKSISELEGIVDDLNYKERALFYISLSYIKLHDKANANRYLKKLRDAYPDSEYIKTLKVLL